MLDTQFYRLIKKSGWPNKVTNHINDFNIVYNSDIENFNLPIKDNKIISIFCYLIRHLIYDYSMFAKV